MQVFVSYPEKEEEKRTFLDNLATFKSKLLLQSIENLNVKNKIKDEVLEKVLEILDDNQNDGVI